MILERLPELPPKPSHVVIERWLPYKQIKRKVIFEKAKEDTQNHPVKQKNLIIQWYIHKYLYNYSKLSLL